MSKKETTKKQRIEDFSASLSECLSKEFDARNIASIASQAYQFGIPAFLNMRQLNEFIQARQYLSPNEEPMGGWLLVRTLADPKTNNNAPNNDTLYGASYVLLDEQGPVVLTVPKIDDRYYSVEILDAYFNNFAVVSSRDYATEGGKFLIAKEGWKGNIPDGITDVFYSPTSSLVLYQRIFIYNDTEYPKVHALQDSITLNPLSGKKFEHIDVGKYKIEGMRDITDPMDFFRCINLYTNANRPPKADGGLIALFATVGLGPDGKLPEEDWKKAAITLGAQEAQQTINARVSSGPFKNGWRVPDPLSGRPGPHILSRAVIQLTQIGSFVPEEAMYFFADKDANNETLTGSCNYILHFDKDEIPPVLETGFWSITMYNDKWLLANNPINRYVLRPSTPGIIWNKDGSLTMYIQNKEPDDDIEKANWLPAPTGNFTIALRAYHPSKQIIGGEWFPSSVTKRKYIK